MSNVERQISGSLEGFAGVGFGHVAVIQVN
jgi:hypothetical protein